MKKLLLLVCLFLPLTAPAAIFELNTRIIVPFTAGGTNDRLARLIAAELKGKTTVENIVGAGGIIAANKISREPANVQQDLILHSDAIIINNIISMDKQYDLFRDLSCVSIIGSTPLVLLSNQQKLSDLKKYTKPVNIGNSGIGSVTYFAGLQFNKIIPSQQISYKGVSGTELGLLSKEIDTMFHFTGAAAPFVKSGKLTAIAITGTTPSMLLPNVPTFFDLGIKDYNWVAHMLLLSNTRMHPEYQKMYNRLVHDILSKPEMVHKLAQEDIRYYKYDTHQSRTKLYALNIQWRKLVD